jgi:hypothetical protein
MANPLRFEHPNRLHKIGARRTVAFVLFVSLGSLALAGCAARRMKVDFTGFESAYAETSNREMLLNLARLENHDPTYFFKLGQISSSYRMEAGLSGFGNYVPQGNTPGGSNVTGGGTPTVLYENDPAFTFIPVNDDTNAQLLLKPVPAETFEILYEQGWRVDQLFRLMIDRIELTESGPNGCTVEVIRNVAPQVDPQTGEALNPDDLRNYVRFLRVSAAVYELQKLGYLRLVGEKDFVPFDKNMLLTEKPSGTNMTDALSKSNAVWEQVGDTWQLGQEVFTPVFKLVTNVDVKTIGEQVSNAPGMKELQTKTCPTCLSTVDEVLTVLSTGFSIQGIPTAEQAAEQQCKPSQSLQISTHLVVRSLIALMAVAAQEQASFDTLLQKDTVVRDEPSSSASNGTQPFKSVVPAVEQLPVLRLTRLPDSAETSPVIELSYRGKPYLIADLTTPPSPDDQYWNRDMFRLVNSLSAQVTVDISKFPLPEVLQLRTQ